jgi:gluconolactonase
MSAATPELAALIGDAELERLATGFEFTEGPIWHPREHHLTFSDMPGDEQRRWIPGKGVASFRKPSNKANGNTYDHRGRMLTCEHATSRVVRTEADGTVSVLATHFEGRELNSPNDIVVGRDGAIYFTDPTYGRKPYYRVERPQQLDFQGVYRMNPDGSRLTLLADDFAQPNGLCFSLDERRLYVNDTERGHIRMFEVSADGRLAGGDVWARVVGEGAGGPDGMKVDSSGSLYCCGPGGVRVFSAAAEPLGVIRLPEVCANFTWGDDDMRSLFFTASRSLYRLRTRIPGRPLF